MKMKLVSLLCLVCAALAPAQANEPNVPSPVSQFRVKFDSGAIVSLKRTADRIDTEYVPSGRRLGDAVIRYRPDANDWQTVQTVALTQGDAATFSTSENGREHKASYRVPDVMTLETRFVVEDKAVTWTIGITNTGQQPLEIGDLALPLSVGGGGRGARGGQPQVPMLKHSFISGHGSFLFWMRGNSVGPYLTLIPSGDTSLEYWDMGPIIAPRPADGTVAFAGGSDRVVRRGGYSVYVHSAAAGAVAKEQGTKWRQPNTSVTIPPGASRSYAFRFRWADDYDGVRQTIVDEGGIDTRVVPGMTVPSDLFAHMALRTKQKINAVEAEFPDATKIEALGRKGEYQIYQVRFAKLGENRLTVRYGDNRHMYLEFFSTEPLETLIKKRGAFLAKSQHHDPSKWYNGLITDWNMKDRVLPSPDNYDLIRGFRIYAVTCDDPGLAKPAYLAAKNAEFPVPSEVEALDYYIKNFVWGGLQRTTDEKYSYGIYGIQDWKRNRDSNDPGRAGQLHLWRVYDYPHIIQMYFAMYRLAKNHPEIKTVLSAKEYLQRAYGTANAMFTVPMEIEKWSAYGTGFYNELVIVDLIDELQAAGMTAEADTLRGYWERKVKNFVNRDQDLFRSEYAFDSTGFESTHALAKYAMQRASAEIPAENAKAFMEKQMASNLFCRGWIEPAYYYLGSDYRGGGGNGYTLTYMSQMGGWGVLDYALNFASNPGPYLELGYASYLSAWALMNSGTPESNYGYWYPGPANDGGAGGGFEPAPYGQTWLGQPHHRGSWYYGCEIDLGYCGALRTAATILADDPIFGRFCFGGDWRKTAEGLEVTPKDGLRRRFYTMLGASRLRAVLDADRFAAGKSITLVETQDLASLQGLRFSIESDNPAQHETRLRISGLPAGQYTLSGVRGSIARLTIEEGQETTVVLPIGNRASAEPFTLAMNK